MNRRRRPIFLTCPFVCPCGNHFPRITERDTGRPQLPPHDLPDRSAVRCRDIKDRGSTRLALLLHSKQRPSSLCFPVLPSVGISLLFSLRTRAFFSHTGCIFRLRLVLDPIGRRCSSLASRRSPSDENWRNSSLFFPRRDFTSPSRFGTAAATTP